MLLSEIDINRIQESAAADYSFHQNQALDSEFMPHMLPRNVRGSGGGTFFSFVQFSRKIFKCREVCATCVFVCVDFEIVTSWKE